jgi:hypothetical protein
MTLHEQYMAARSAFRQLVKHYRDKGDTEQAKKALIISKVVLAKLRHQGL